MTESAATDGPVEAVRKTVEQLRTPPPMEPNTWPEIPRTSAAWIVMADDLFVGGPFYDREDAEGFASSWNSAYPPPEHTEFVVEQITAEEARHLDRRNV